MAVTMRSRTLTFLVGSTRAFRQQLDQTAGELAELKDNDLRTVEQMVQEIGSRLHTLDDLATRKLRES